MPRWLLAITLLLLSISLAAAQTKDKDKGKESDTPKDSPIVAKSRQKLETKVSVNFKDERLKDAMKELFNQASLAYQLDTKGGVSQNQSFTYSCEDKPLKDVLEEMFKGRGLGYIIHRKKNANDRYEGYIDIVQGDNRGDEAAPKKSGDTPKKKGDK